MENVFRVLATGDAQTIEQLLFKREQDSVSLDDAHSSVDDVPFVKHARHEHRAHPDAPLIARCEALLCVCLTEMNQLISALDIRTLANDFIVSGLIAALVLLISDHPETQEQAHQQVLLPLAIRRRTFFKVMCETQRLAAEPPPAFLRLIDLLKLAFDDCADVTSPSYFSLFSSSGLRLILHDLSDGNDESFPPGHQNIHGCECNVSKYDTNFLAKLEDALKYHDRRLLPQSRPGSYAYYHSFGSDRREQGFTQTLSFQEPADWEPRHPLSRAPARMWLCRRKCPPFNVEGRRMFVKENGVIGCGNGSCGDDKKFDYTMCQACSVSYKLQPPDFTTALEVYHGTSLSDAVLMLPHHRPTTSEPLVNRAGAAVKPGRGGMVVYCGRNLGKAEIPGSDGVCGPSNGPQCSDCAFSFPVVAGPAGFTHAESHPSQPPYWLPGSLGFAVRAPPPSAASRLPAPSLFGAPGQRAFAFGAAAPAHPGLFVPPSETVVSAPVASSVPPPDPAIISQLVDQMGFNANAAARAASAGDSAFVVVLCIFNLNYFAVAHVIMLYFIS
jgi:hypothetical protein